METEIFQRAQELQEANVQLRDLQSDLELRVDARTAELQRANEDLQREIQEHRRTSEALRLSEAQFRHSQKMEAVGRLAGSVAHDFNNLLSVILSYSSLLLADLKSVDPIRADIDSIRKAGEKAAVLTRQLLAFSRQQVLAPRVLDLNDILYEAEQMLRRLLAADIELITRNERALSKVKVDPSQMDQVIMNLAINARDAMPDGGKLVIETLNVTPDSDYLDAHANIVPGDLVMLSVTDTGTGMDAETQRRIFEPFFTTKEVGKGTGLGLATVYGIVQQSGGQIRVSSELGRGSVFKVYFPRQPIGTESDPVRPPSVAPATVGGTILVVEDNAAVRQVASRILRERGHLVLEARDPAEARALFAAHSAKIDLLLTDVIMPECTGPQLARGLIQLSPTLRVLYMSGYPGGAADRAGTLEAGAAYIEKPFSPDALAEKISVVFSHRNDLTK